MIGVVLRKAKMALRSRVVRVAGTLLRLGEEQKLAELRGALAHCGRNAVLRPPLHIEGPGQVSIGDDTSLNPFIHMWGHGGIEIGARTMIASHTAIVSVTHDPDSGEMHATLLSGPVRIANDVWIGAHAVIMPGVIIGAHAVVAAGAVVREDVPAYAVVAGVPAKVVRMKTQARTATAPARPLRSAAP